MRPPAIAVCLLTLLLGAGQALAQPRAGAVRAGAGIRAFELGHNFDTDTTSVVAGISNFTPGFEVGVQIEDWLVLATRLQLAVRDLGGDSDAVLTVGILPRAEFLIGSNQTIVPFLAPQLGASVAANDDSSSVILVAGVQSGFHVFVTRSFSVSPGLEVNYLNLLTQGDFSGLQIAATLLFSGWF